MGFIINADLETSQGPTQELYIRIDGFTFNKVTAQEEMEVKNKKRIIVCEHCGRIFCPPDIWEKYFPN